MILEPHQRTYLTRRLTAQQRLILEALERSHPVSCCIGTLVQRLWPEGNRPAAWRSCLYGQVHRLRTVLTRIGAPFTITAEVHGPRSTFRYLLDPTSAP